MVGKEEGRRYEGEKLARDGEKAAALFDLWAGMAKPFGPAQKVKVDLMCRSIVW